MTEINEIMDLYITGIEWGVVLTILIGAVSWGFWIVVRFFKNISRA